MTEKSRDYAESEVLRDNIPGFEVRYGDGNNMIFVIPDID